MTIEAPLARPTQMAQWLAVVVALVLTVGLAVGLPRLASATAPQDTALVAGQRVEAAGVSIVAAPGWALTGGTDLLVISKGDSKLIIFPPDADTRTAEASVSEAAKSFTDDPTSHAKAGDITTFTTDSGLKGASVTVVEADAITQLIAFSDGTVLSEGTLSSTPTTAANQAKEIDTMLTTVELGKVSTP